MVRTPIQIGVTLAVTVAIGYAACTALFALWPDAAAGFMNALFHGLDFRKLQSGTAPFSFGGFLAALLGMVIWTFMLGTLFGWLSGLGAFSARSR